MITLIFGEDTVSSRTFLFDIRSEKKDITTIDGESLSIPDLVPLLEGNSLFEEEKNILIENFFSKRKSISKEFKDIVSYLSTHEKGANIYFWDGKDLTKTAQSAFKNPKINQFKLPQKLFAFLESLRPNAGISSLKLAHEVTEQLEPELLFYMMVRQFRMLLSLSLDPSGNSIEETQRLAPWQRQKIVSQSRLFSQIQLQNIYNKLYDLDLGSKTGGNTMPLASHIDIFLLDL